MKYLILVLFLSLSCWADQLIEVSELKMFVDELPDMPRIKGYKVKNGVPVPADLKIGMFHKKWVSCIYEWLVNEFTLLFFQCCVGFINSLLEIILMGFD